MIKKIAAVTAAVVMLASSSAFAEQFHTYFNSFDDLEQVNVIVDGVSIYSDVPPITIDGRTLVPIRAVSEALTAFVEWDEASETVYITKRSDVLSLKIGNEFIVKNGVEIPLDVPAQIINDRTLIPLRAVSEALSANVSWDETANTATITSKQSAHYISDKYIVFDETHGFKGILAYPIIANSSGSEAIDKINATFKEENLRTIILRLEGMGCNDVKVSFEVESDTDELISYKFTAKGNYKGEYTTKEMTFSFNPKTGDML